MNKQSEKVICSSTPCFGSGYRYIRYEGCELMECKECSCDECGKTTMGNEGTGATELPSDS